MSLFQKHPPNPAIPPLSFGIEQALLDHLREQEAVNETTLVDAITAAYSLAYSDDAIKRYIQQLIDSVLSRIEELQKGDSQQPPAPNQYGKTLGTQYSDWLSDLDPSGICLYLAGYDVNKAYEFYWHTDNRLVQEAVKLKGQHDSHQVLAQMEACMYGFGGRYAEDSGTANHFDLSSGEGMDALRSAGF